MLFIMITNVRLKRYTGFKITVNKCHHYKKSRLVYVERLLKKILF
jgi:hypothetical protein